MGLGLLITAGTSLLVAVAFMDVAASLARWSRSESRPEHMAFAFFWGCLGIQALLTGTRVLLASEITLNKTLFVWLFAVENIAATAALWGFAAFVSYARWGRRGWVPGAIAVAALAGVYTFMLLRSELLEIVLKDWVIKLVFEQEIGLRGRAVLAAVYYLSLLGLTWVHIRQVLATGASDATLRASATGIAMVLVAFVGFTNVALAIDTMLGPLIAAFHLVAAALVLVAFFPPESLRIKLGLPD